jgi:hypothetical protein
MQTSHLWHQIHWCHLNTLISRFEIILVLNVVVCCFCCNYFTPWSWEGNSHSAGQEIPHLLWNLRFITVFTRGHHRTVSCVIESSLHPYTPFP